MSKRERTLLMVLGGVAVVAALWFLFLRGGGDEPIADDGVTTPPTFVQPPPDPTPSGPPKLPPLAIFGGRDPFFPLVRTGTGTDGTGTPPSPDPTGSPVPSVSPPSSPSPGGDTIGGHDVRVLDVFVRDGEEVVQVEVDGQVFTVTEGETFAENFRVVSIDGRCATFLFGDEQFTLCEPGARPK